MKYSIRAYYTKEYIRVYQAYSDTIADSVLASGKFISPPFNLSRMTWIKPSFLWMMHRSGWGGKEQNQKRILAIDLKHSAFSEILSLGVSSNFEQSDFSCFEEWKILAKNSDVLIQWDPDRDILLNKMERRTIQIGLRNDAVIKYVNEWIVNITDVTGFSNEIKNLVLQGEIDKALAKLPKEYVYYV